MTPRQIRLITEARQDMLAGKAFYDRQQQGIGDYFWDSLLADMESLHIHAGVHQQFYGYYRVLSKRFPYALYYQLSPRHITIVAILPVRRNPAWLSTQFQQRTP